jgi:predicted kinase
MKIDLTKILLIIVVILIGLQIYTSYLLREANKENIDIRLQQTEKIIGDYFSQIKSKKDSTIIIEKHIYELEKSNEKKKDTIYNTDNIDRVRGMYIQLRSNDSDYRF